MNYFIALITFTSPDGDPLDFGDYCAGVGMWICMLSGVVSFALAINIWLHL